MTDKIIDEYAISEREISSDETDGETIYTESEISEDESMNTSEEEFIDDSSDVGEDESSDDEYVPPHKQAKS